MTGSSEIFTVYIKKSENSEGGRVQTKSVLTTEMEKKLMELRQWYNGLYNDGRTEDLKRIFTTH